MLTQSLPDRATSTAWHPALPDLLACRMDTNSACSIGLVTSQLCARLTALLCLQAPTLVKTLARSLPGRATSTAWHTALLDLLACGLDTHSACSIELVTSQLCARLTALLCLQAPTLVKTLAQSLPGRATSTAWHPALSDLLACGLDTHSACSVELVTSQLCARLTALLCLQAPTLVKTLAQSLPGRATSTAWHPALSDLLACGFHTGDVALVSPARGTWIRASTKHPAPVRQLAWLHGMQISQFPCVLCSCSTCCAGCCCASSGSRQSHALVPHKG